MLLSLLIGGGCSETGQTLQKTLETGTDSKSLIGTWVGECKTYTDINNWIQNRFTFSETAIKLSRSSYSDSECKTVKENPINEFIGTYRQIGIVETASGLTSDWYFIDYTNTDEQLEEGFYLTNDTLYPVLKSEGVYKIYFNTPYYRSE